MFRPEDLLDLRQFGFPQLFDGCEFAWDALKKLPGFVKAHLRPAQLGTVRGTPFIGEQVFIGKGTVIEHGAVINGPAIIGENCQIRSSAYIRENVMVGNGCVLGNASEFKGCVLFDGCQVPHFSYVGDSILGAKAHLGAGVILSNVKALKGNVWVGERDTGLRKFGAILGDGADIGCNCVLNPGSIIGRNSILYPNVLWRGVCPADRVVKLRQQHDLVIRRK
ncbi:MAG: Bifunctional protein GlmU [Verrucomicrobiae bacterium]|nr:Bifunctional protein GlmU [Verrucomicrobiae bacterium]